MDIATRDHDELNDHLAKDEGASQPEQAPASEGPVRQEGPDEEASASEDDKAATTDARAAAVPRSRGPGQDRTDEELADEACALLFASAEPLSQARLVELLQRPEPARVRAALDLLAERLRAAGLPIVLQELGGGWRLMSDPEAGDVLQRLRKEARPERISSAALETLAIVAYRQPVTKAEIEAIRGVQSGALLRSLVDRGLARVSGRADLPGSPLQYATTRDFLDRFGLGSLKDLPRDAELTSD